MKTSSLSSPSLSTPSSSTRAIPAAPAPPKPQSPQNDEGSPLGFYFFMAMLAVGLLLMLLGPLFLF